MSVTPAAAFLELVGGRRGHFRLESGYHSGLWLDLDSLFTEPKRVAPFVTALADALRPHDVSAVCGPLLGGAFVAQLVAHALSIDFWFTERFTSRAEGLYPVRYRLPSSLRDRARGKRVAIVDDVMSAGSALRGTYMDLRAHEAVPVVAGALLVLGTVGASFFAECGLPVEAAAREDYALWMPAQCPLCSAGAPIEDPTPPTA